LCCNFLSPNCTWTRHGPFSFHKTNNEAAVKKNKNSKCRNMEGTKEKQILLSGVFV
jgi:hypothetical protein